ncbi:hypothetical protein CYMTET_33177, partial [Cymbomonas tetramitiformis]
YAVMGWLAAAQSLIIAAAHKVVGGIFQFFAFTGEPMFQVAQALFPHGKAEEIRRFKVILPIMGCILGVVIGAIAVAATLAFPNLFTNEPQVVMESLKVMWPFFFSLMLIIPSRTMQGLVVAEQDLAFYAGLMAVNAVLFAGAVAMFAINSTGPYMIMWWLHVAFYVINNIQFAMRIGQQRKLQTA